MKLDKREYYLTSLQDETLEITSRMWRVLPFVKKEGEKTVYWDLLKYLFDRYYLITSIKNKNIIDKTPMYNTTIDYLIQKDGNMSNKLACSLSNIKNIISSAKS